MFFSDAAALGWAALLRPYAGYLHAVPRIIAALTGSLPWEYQPAAYVLAAGAVAAWVVGRMSCARLPLSERIMAAIALFALPQSGEVFLNVTNLQWILDVLLVVNLMEAGPEKTGETWRRTLELMLAGFSGPLVIILAPFAAVWSWRWRRTRRAWPLTAAWTVAVLVQVCCLRVSGRPVGGSLHEVLSSFHWIVPRYGATLFVGDWFPYTVGMGWLAATGALLATFVLFADRSNRHRRRSLWLIVLGAAALWAGRAANPYWPNPTGGGARYAYVPLVLLLWAFASLAVGTERRAHRALAGLLYGTIIWSAVPRWIAVPLPPDNWTQQVREAQAGTRARFEVAPSLSFPVPPLPSRRGPGS